MSGSVGGGGAMVVWAVCVCAVCVWVGLGWRWEVMRSGHGAMVEELFVLLDDIDRREFAHVGLRARALPCADDFGAPWLLSMHRVFCDVEGFALPWLLRFTDAARATRTAPSTLRTRPVTHAHIINTCVARGYGLV